MFVQLQTGPVDEDGRDGDGQGSRNELGIIVTLLQTV